MLASGIRLLPAIALLCLGCAMVDHARSTNVYGQTLLVRRSDGAEQLRLESEYDSAVRQFVKTHGDPVYLHAEDRKRLYLFYLSEDIVAVFQRGMLPPGEVTKVRPIPGSLLTLLPEKEQHRVLAQRKGRKGAVARAAISKKKAPPAKPRRRSAAAAAAPSGTAGVTISFFEVNDIVARLKRPMSAADPGVSGWRHGTLRGGGPVRSGSIGSTRYVVMQREISVMASISPSHRSAPPALRVGYVRINNAVFGARADSVSGAVGPLVAKVAADPSGRTRLARRINGRTVTVSRVPSKNLLVYAVRPD